MTEPVRPKGRGAPQRVGARSDPAGPSGAAGTSWRTPQGGDYTVAGIQLLPRPVQRPGVPVWVGAWSAPWSSDLELECLVDSLVRLTDRVGGALPGR